jgi:hypothetical protein
MTVLDYGCGACRYAQFLRQRLSTFQYYGMEKLGSVSEHGQKSIKVARKLFRWDRRVHCGFIGSALEATAIARADVGVLGSILTHTDLAESENILRKFRPIMSRGGKIVFSIFLANEYKLGGPGHTDSRIATRDHGSPKTSSGGYGITTIGKPPNRNRLSRRASTYTASSR